MLKSMLGRLRDDPVQYGAKNRNTTKGGYSKGIFDKKSKAPKTKLRKKR